MAVDKKKVDEFISLTNEAVELFKSGHEIVTNPTSRREEVIRTMFAFSDALVLFKQAMASLSNEEWEEIFECDSCPTKDTCKNYQAKMEREAFGISQ